jgi:hypothetical protein
MSLDDYLEARDQLIEKDLVAFDGRIFQVLCLPDQPSWVPPPILKTKTDMERKDPATVDQICRRAFGVKNTADKRHGGRR